MAKTSRRGRKPKDFFSGRLGRYVLAREHKLESISTPYHAETRITIPRLSMDKYQRDAVMSGAFAYQRTIAPSKELPVSPREAKEEYIIYFKRGSDPLLKFGYTLADVKKLCPLFLLDDPDLLAAKKLLKKRTKFPPGSIDIFKPMPKKSPKGGIFAYYEVDSDGVVII